MAKLIPAAERVIRARALIQQARDLIKFIPQTAGVSAEMKEDVKKIYEEIEQANRETLYSA
jgi:ABC-type Na+ transport system ATPase subunit NatA